MLVLMLDEDDVADVNRGGSATAADAAAVGDGSGDDDRDGAEPVLEVAPLEVLALAWATSVVLVVFWRLWRCIPHTRRRGELRLRNLGRSRLSVKRLPGRLSILLRRRGRLCILLRLWWGCRRLPKKCGIKPILQKLREGLHVVRNRGGASQCHCEQPPAQLIRDLDRLASWWAG